MKIGIMTASRTNNYGTDLQMLAMQQLFKAYSTHVEIINYKCYKLENSRKILKKLALRDLLISPIQIHKKIYHHSFRKKYINYSKKVYDEDTFLDIHYDIVVVGSDQIWNLELTGGDINFFLPNAVNVKNKFSYAASFGRTDLTYFENRYRISKYLDLFKQVSVRESISIDALETIGIDSRQDLDPLLMVDKSFWLSIINKKNNRKKKKPYIFVYLVEYNKIILNLVKQYARERNLSVVYHSNGVKPISARIKVKRFVSIERWLSLMEGSEMIITNSYHGLSFSLALEKNFRMVSLQNDKESNSRLLGLLRDFRLMKFDINNTPINITTPDWIKVKEIIENRRILSMRYIKQDIVGSEENE